MAEARKRALITGATSGIGLATAQRFAAEGWDVCLNGRRSEVLDEVVAMLSEGDHLHVAGDYADPATASRLHAEVADRWDGAVDALINCAGVAKGGDAIETPLNEWRQCFDTMVNGAINMTRLVVPMMRRGSRIVHVTSIHSGRAERGAGSYGMAKAAIDQYCRALALELADRGILVNAIAPGFVETAMSSASGVNELETDWFQRNYVQGDHLPLRRAGQPEEIAGVALFLAGPDASYLTGQVIVVDGGLTITF